MVEEQGPGVLGDAGVPSQLVRQQGFVRSLAPEPQLVSEAWNGYVQVHEVRLQALARDVALLGSKATNPPDATPIHVTTPINAAARLCMTVQATYDGLDVGVHAIRLYANNTTASARASRANAIYTFKTSSHTPTAYGAVLAANIAIAIARQADAFLNRLLSLKATAEELLGTVKARLVEYGTHRLGGLPNTYYRAAKDYDLVGVLGVGSYNVVFEAVEKERPGGKAGMRARKGAAGAAEDVAAGAGASCSGGGGNCRDARQRVAVRLCLPGDCAMGHPGPLSTLKNTRAAQNEAACMRGLRGVRGMLAATDAYVPSNAKHLDQLAVVMELFPGTSLAARRSQPLGLGLVRTITIKLVGTMAEVHELGAAHRDLSPANVLLAGPGLAPGGAAAAGAVAGAAAAAGGGGAAGAGGSASSSASAAAGEQGQQAVVDVRVADFGMAVVGGSKPLLDDPWTSRDPATRTITMSTITTRTVRAPEACVPEMRARLATAEDWQPADVWAVGCLVYGMLVAEPLVASRSDEEHPAWLRGLCGVQDGCPAAGPSLEQQLLRVDDPAARAFISATCAWDPRDRPTMAELRQHPFLTGEPLGPGATVVLEAAALPWYSPAMKTEEPAPAEACGSACIKIEDPAPALLPCCGPASAPPESQNVAERGQMEMEGQEEGCQGQECEEERGQWPALDPALLKGGPGSLTCSAAATRLYPDSLDMDVEPAPAASPAYEPCAPPMGSDVEPAPAASPAYELCEPPMGSDVGMGALPDAEWGWLSKPGGGDGDDWGLLSSSVGSASSPLPALPSPVSSPVKIPESPRGLADQDSAGVTAWTWPVAPPALGSPADSPPPRGLLSPGSLSWADPITFSVEVMAGPAAAGPAEMACAASAAVGCTSGGGAAAAAAAAVAVGAAALAPALPLPPVPPLPPASQAQGGQEGEREEGEVSAAVLAAREVLLRSAYSDDATSAEHSRRLKALHADLMAIRSMAQPPAVTGQRRGRPAGEDGGDGDGGGDQQPVRKSVRLMEKQVVVG